jgi:hypothetical protein
VEKLVYLLHKNADQKVTAEFAQRAGRDIVPQLKAAGVSDIVLTVCDLHDKVRDNAPERLIAPIAGAIHSLAGAIHFWLENLDDRFTIEPILRGLAPQISGYLVTESVLQRAPRTWKSGERRPGVTQLALMCKSSSVSEEEFYHNWQQLHSKFSFRLHPLRLEYVRNAVARTLTPGSAPYRMIVLQQWGELRDILEPERYTDKAAWDEVRTEPKYGDIESLVLSPTSEYEFD